MRNNVNVIIFDKMTTTKIRIRRIFEDQGIKVSEATTQLEIMNSIDENENRSNILIIHIEGEEEEYSFGIMKRIMDKYSDVPIVVLTSITKKTFFMRCISEGASDYILKPFNDFYLRERVLKLIKNSGKNLKRNSITEFTNTITFNFDEYIYCETVKAKKGSYAFTILKTTLDIPQNEDNEDNVEMNNEYVNIIYKGLKTLFWDTDIFIQYDEENFLGYFPFCPEDNTVVIEDKIKKKFEEIKSYDESLTNYDISNIFVTFPYDGTEVKVLLDKLFPKAIEPETTANNQNGKVQFKRTRRRTPNY